MWLSEFLQEMSLSSAALLLLMIWTALLVALVIVIGRQGQGGALTLGSFLNLSLVHVPGVLPYLVSTPEHAADPDATRLGFGMTVLGLAVFVAGAVLARRIDRPHAAAKGAPRRQRPRVSGSLGWRAIALGVVAFFVVLPLATIMPSLTSIVLPLATLLILGMWLRLYDAAAAADWRRALGTLALLPLLPVATLVAGGFLYYGTAWVLSIVTFHFVISRRRIWFYIAAPPLVFLGLSLFVTYMDQRAEFRAVREHESLFERLDRASYIVTDFELLDLTSPAQVEIIDNRLNQNLFVGLGVMRHEAGWYDFLYGGTVPLWSLIPRAVWPDKPDVGGGGNILRDFIGIPVAVGTSQGPGEVLEFYMNFGVPGVLIGFLGLGYLLMWLDHGVMRALTAGNTRGFLLRAMPGLALLPANGGNLLEALVGGVAAVVVAHLIVWLRFADIGAALPRRRLPGEHVVSSQ